MRRPFTVEAEYSSTNLEKAETVHHTHTFSSFDAAAGYAHWASYCAVFRWALVRYERRPVLLWDNGIIQYYNYKILPKE